MTMLDPVETLQHAFPKAVQDVQEFRGEVTIVVASSRIADVCQFCRDTKGLAYDRSRASVCLTTCTRWHTTAPCASKHL